MDEGNGLFYIRVNDTEPSYRLVTAPVATPGKAHWTELIAARKDAPIEDVDVFKDFYVVTERVKGLPVLRVVRRANGASARRSSFRSRHTSLSAAIECGVRHRRSYRYNYQSPITPSSTFDIRRRESRLPHC